MIHYQLRCDDGHSFDGWFRDSAGYEDQAARGLVVCPECGQTQVARALMAPAVARKGNAPRPSKAVAPASAPVTAPAAPVPERMPDQLRALLQKVRREVERTCEHVGPDFAAEARRIHDGEAEARGIYGEATEAEAEALRDDGIEVGRIPWLPPADA